MNKEEAQALVFQAIRSLTGRCDGALRLDNQGWSRMDTDRGHTLCGKIEEGIELSPADRVWIANHLPKYHRQVGDTQEALEVLGWTEEARLWTSRRKQWERQRQEAQREREQLVNNPFLPRLDFDSRRNKLFLYTRPQDRELAKQVPHSRWMGETKAWEYPATREVIEAFEGILNRIPAITEEAQKLLEEYRRKATERQNQLERVRQIKNGASTQTSPPIKTTPYRHQVSAFEVGITLPHSALLMEQGTGKTLSAIAVAGYRYQQGQIKRLLVVCPKSVLGEWKRQFREHAAFPYRLEILEGDLATRAQILTEWVDSEGLQVVVVNYEATWRLEEELKKWKPDMVIADESQKIKNGQTNQAKALTAIGRVAQYRMIMTGTPVTQSPLDFFSQYRFLDPTVFGSSFVRFRSRYAIMGGYGGYRVVGYKNLEELAEKAHSIAFRVRKEEALDLPDTVDQVLWAELEPEAKRLYQEMQQEALLLFEEGTVTAPIVLTQLLRLQQITGGFLPLFSEEEEVCRQVSTAKMEVLMDTLEDLLGAGKKVVVFARFLPEVEEISRRLIEKGIKHCRLTGKASNRQREKMIQEFQHNKEVKIFVAQIATGGLGITLTAADTAIFYSVDFSLANYEQARARIHRIGQTRKVTYIHIVAQGTLDEEVLARLQSKQDVARMVVDDLKDILTGGTEMARVVGKEAQQAVARAVEAQEQERELEQLLDELEQELQASEVSKEEKREPEKKEVEKKSKKTKEEPTNNDEIVTVKELAAELEMEPAKLRKWLRSRFGKAEGRWEWKKNSPQLKEIRDFFRGGN